MSASNSLTNYDYVTVGNVFDHSKAMFKLSIPSEVKLTADQ
jgi:hypothetical protein